MTLTRCVADALPEQLSLTKQPDEAAAESGVGEAAVAGIDDPTSPVIRYGRGSRVFAIDGLVGTLRQVVIDEDRGEIKALVIRESTKKESVLVPPDLVSMSADGALLLNVTREQFFTGASRSPRFNRRMFVAADRRHAASTIPFVFQGDRRRSLVRLSQDYVETSDRLDVGPMPQVTSSPRRICGFFKRNPVAVPGSYSTALAD